MPDDNLVKSFSYTKDNTKAVDAVSKLKLKAKLSGLPFSTLVVKAIIKYVEEMEK